MDTNHDQSTWVEEETSPYSYPKVANMVNQSMTPQMDSQQRSFSGADFFDSFQPDAVVQVSYTSTVWPLKVTSNLFLFTPESHFKVTILKEMILN